MRPSTAAHLLALAAIAAGCGEAAPQDCREAEDRLGFAPCVHRVGSGAEWAAIAAEVEPVDQVRTARYLLPAHQDARLPPVFEIAAAGFSGHYQFLREAFPDRFPALDLDDYVSLITDPEAREYFAGSITEYVRADGSRVFGFIVWDTQEAVGSVSCDQLNAVAAALEEVFSAAPLAAVPTTDLQRQVLADCDVASYDAARALEYEVYNRTIGYGTVRRYRLHELATATREASFGFQDILVLEEAPFDIETVIAGSITGTRQGELSHLNVRSASRGTPNCYLRDAYQVMARWEGELVRIACGAAGLGVAPATREEAEAWWEQLRPSPVSVPEPDLDFGSMPGLLEMPAATAAERTLGVRRYGAKASNLGTLYQRIDPALRLGPGFAIPMRYYQEHLVAGGFDETIADLLADDELATDGAARRVALAALRESIAAAPCDPELLAAIGDRIGEVFGDPGVMVRFRSSSNAEDALDFSGAGLYSSRSVCLADDLDGDDAGPSRCDPSEAKERGVCSGLKEVWASLWRPQAYNERAWYGIDHSRAAMAILVNPRAAAERANIVAFTGNPLGPDLDRYLVNAQTGELDVVSSRPGVWPEKDLLTIEDARVVAIERVRGSSELEPGDHVLDDLRLRELGAGLVAIAGLFPVDGTPPEGRRVLLDTEWKITADGRLVIKQVRPFIDASR